MSGVASELGLTNPHPSNGPQLSVPQADILFCFIAD